MKVRCEWPGDDPLYVSYHDKEWGVPVYDDQKLFEFLVLEGAQAGLSWITILKRRDGYRRAFDDFKVERVANYGDRDVKRLLADEGIIRNRQKIHAAISNARAFIGVQKEFGTFADYNWGFVNGKTKKNAWKTISEVPAFDSDSEAMSKDLRKRGFKFVGPTIAYAHLQAAGMINDHVVSCFRYNEV
ncbi:MAG: DNA-3-methyladenine glycosylase I [Chloroflexi bacterium]|nr:DNA-3-methyladenine glycosylase I [Chloroflexota bacterium]